MRIIIGQNCCSKPRGSDVYGRAAPQRGTRAVFVSGFYLPTREGREGATEEVYSLSNRKTNYKGLSGCTGEQPGNLCPNLLFPNPINFLLDFVSSRFRGQNCRIFVCS